MSSHIGSDGGTSPRRNSRMYAALALLLTGYFSMALMAGLLDPRSEVSRKKTVATPMPVVQTAVTRLQP